MTDHPLLARLLADALLRWDRLPATVAEAKATETGDDDYWAAVAERLVSEVIPAEDADRLEAALGEDAPGPARCRVCADREEDAQDCDRLRDALEGMTDQFAHWTPGPNPGLTTGGLSALEHAFDALGWAEPHDAPERRCDEPGCAEEATCGWPARPGGAGPNGGYRRTCLRHMAPEGDR